MPRPRRIHEAGSLYYVRLRGNAGQTVVGDEEDRNELERLLALAIERHQSRVHAFCWLPREILLALQISQVPLGRVIQAFASPYARRVQLKREQHGHLFTGPYRALLVDGDEYLTQLVRHIHRAPLRARLVTQVEEYRWSSHRAYLSFTVVPWLTVQTTLHRFGRERNRARAAYRAFVAEEVSEAEVASFESSRPRVPPIIGSESFVSSRLGPRSQPQQVESLNRLITSVARTLGVSREDVVSVSRRRHLSLARAVITWHATRSGLASLAEVARWLHRHPSTLTVAVERYRHLRRELFRPPKTLHEARFR
jgi:REP element-mobilizing transposase RayT